MPPLPDPALLCRGEFAPRARRRLRVFGAEAELVWLPERGSRPGRPMPERPAFGPDAAARIVAEETVWRGEGLALTPNRYPFARDQGVLWSEQATREHDAAFLATLFAWVDAHGGTALVNGIGAAASIARAHAHVTPEELPFLAALPLEPLDSAWAAAALAAASGASLIAARVPFALVGARGAAPARAAAVAALQVRRLTAACNLVSTRGVAWVYPRSLEIPAPHFPYALGAAELWGRWCYVDEAAFLAATPGDLERALVAAGCAPWTGDVQMR